MWELIHASVCTSGRSPLFCLIARVPIAILSSLFVSALFPVCVGPSLGVFSCLCWSRSIFSARHSNIHGVFLWSWCVKVAFFLRTRPVIFGSPAAASHVFEWGVKRFTSLIILLIKVHLGIGLLWRVVSSSWECLLGNSAGMMAGLVGV